MKDKIAIITGSSGIAAETIKLVVRAGGHVFYIGRSKDNCEILANELSDEGLHADYLVGDLTDPSVAPTLVSN